MKKAPGGIGLEICFPPPPPKKIVFAPPPLAPRNYKRKVISLGVNINIYKGGGVGFLGFFLKIPRNVIGFIKIRRALLKKFNYYF